MPKMNYRSYLLSHASWVGLAACLALTSLPVQAQVDEIVVTARRREEALSKVPTAVTAFGAEQIAQRSIASQEDLQSSVPGLTVRQTEGSNNLLYAIRGQSIDPFSASPAAVVAYLNEVQLPTGSGSASTFFDLASLQVLKGPQGTLFGRNATGGAVLFTSIKPKEEFGGYIKVRAGNFSMREVLGAVDIPIVKDKVLLRIAGDGIARKGYQHNIYYNTDYGEVDRQSARGTLVVRPTDSLENTLVYEYGHAGGNSSANRLYSVNTGSGCAPAGILNCAAGATFSPATFGPAWNLLLAAQPRAYPNGLLGWLQDPGGQSSLGFWDVNEAVWSSHHSRSHLVSNTTTYDIGPNMQLKNIFGYSQSYTRDLATELGAPFTVIATENRVTGEKGNIVDQEAYSEELQLQGKMFKEALTYVIGGYYRDEKTTTTYPQTYFDLTGIVPNTLGVNALTNHWKVSDRTEAMYAQATYDLGTIGLHGLSLTTGYRYSWEQIKINFLPGDTFNSAAPQQDLSFSNPSWTAGLSYQATDELMLYIQGRRSWRTGGFNGVAPPVFGTAAVGGNIYYPEFTKDVEIGAKYAGRAFGRPLRANVAVFKQWIDQAQRAEYPVHPITGASIAVTVNVPQATIVGLELDGAFEPMEWLEIGAAGTLTYPKFIDGKNEVLIFGQNFIFGPYADTPRATGALYGAVTLPVPEAWGSMKIRAELYAQTGMYFSQNANQRTPNTRIPGYGLVNLRYDWHEAFGSKLSISAFAKNVTQKEYYSGGLSIGASLGANSAAVGQPRMYGFEVSYDF